MLSRMYGLEYEDVTWFLLQIQAFIQCYSKNILTSLRYYLIELFDPEGEITTSVRKGVGNNVQADAT